jgi:hypothetical protein
MAKKIEIPAADSPYVLDNAPKQPWLQTKRGKLIAAIAGGVVILGGTFAAGVQVGEHMGGSAGTSRFGFGDDHHFGGPDDHGFNPNGMGGQNGQFQVPNGQLPMQPGQVAPSAAPSIVTKP